MTTRTDAEVDDIMRQWREWFASTGAPETLAAMRGDAPEGIEGDGIDLMITSDACPTQIEGTVDRMGLYFRARHGVWRLDIAATVDAAVGGAGSVYHADGDDDTGGWMPRAEAWRIVRDAVAAFRAQAVQR